MDNIGNLIPDALKKKMRYVQEAIKAETNVAVDEVFARPCVPYLVSYLREQYPDSYAQVLKENQLDVVQAQRKINEGDYVIMKKMLISLMKYVPLSEDGNYLYEDIAKKAGLQKNEISEAVKLMEIAGNIKVDQVLKIRS